VDGFVGSYELKLFAAMFMSFGIWTYHMKKHTLKKLLGDLLIKFSSVFVGAIIVANLSGVVMLTSLYGSFFYPLTIIVLYMLINKKSKCGNNFRGSAAEFLNQRFGRAPSIVPKVLLFFAVMVSGIFNAPVWMFLVFLLCGFALEHLFVFMCFKKSSNNNLSV
jgi:hypothetical protein